VTLCSSHGEAVACQLLPMFAKHAHMMVTPSCCPLAPRAQALTKAGVLDVPDWTIAGEVSQKQTGIDNSECRRTTFEPLGWGWGQGTSWHIQHMWPTRYVGVVDGGHTRHALQQQHPQLSASTTGSCSAFTLC
jgi:hypothetical protein